MNWVYENAYFVYDQYILYYVYTTRAPGIDLMHDCISRISQEGYNTQRMFQKPFEAHPYLVISQTICLTGLLLFIHMHC